MRVYGKLWVRVSLQEFLNNNSKYYCWWKTAIPIGQRFWGFVHESYILFCWRPHSKLKKNNPSQVDIIYRGIEYKIIKYLTILYLSLTNYLISLVIAKNVSFLSVLKNICPFSWGFYRKKPWQMVFLHETSLYRSNITA